MKQNKLSFWVNATQGFLSEAYDYPEHELKVMCDVECEFMIFRIMTFGGFTVREIKPHEEHLVNIGGYEYGKMLFVSMMDQLDEAMAVDSH